jgi:prophage regulatory protein
MNSPAAIHTHQTGIKRDRFLRLPDVEQATGLKKSTIYLMIRRGDFPKPIALTPRCVAWPESVVLQWIQDRINGAGA